ncbi:universal stress protein family, putative [Synechococcus sp. PCC 7335]|uniref:universal stress protein n=1 Tax=Synechococcus sp. (strain ATCC 29403 / PCC 7335) TaxID=91464 RepID=UPI00017EBCC5|nr:universal stress protein [Synechococcus sp. PCC 7335]EDX83594.1 universal stress protein family, putative [Synechococcus sp. PCC 7335]
MFNKILVALDTKEPCDLLLQEAIALAKATTSSLVILGVLTLDADGTLPLLSHPEIYQKRYEEFKAGGLAILRRYLDQAIAGGIQATIHQEIGDPGKTICQVAKEEDADLIIVGSHGRKGIGELLMGSVSSYVVHRAPCSVFVVRKSETTHSDNTNSDITQLDSNKESNPLVGI